MLSLIPLAGRRFAPSRPRRVATATVAERAKNAPPRPRRRRCGQRRRAGRGGLWWPFLRVWAWPGTPSWPGYGGYGHTARRRLWNTHRGCHADTGLGFVKALRRGRCVERVRAWGVGVWYHRGGDTCRREAAVLVPSSRASAGVWSAVRPRAVGAVHSSRRRRFAPHASARAACCERGFV